MRLYLCISACLYVGERKLARSKRSLRDRTSILVEWEYAPLQGQLRLWGNINFPFEGKTRDNLLRQTNLSGKMYAVISYTILYHHIVLLL